MINVGTIYTLENKILSLQQLVYIVIYVVYDGNVFNVLRAICITTIPMYEKKWYLQLNT